MLLSSLIFFLLFCASSRFLIHFLSHFLCSLFLSLGRRSFVSCMVCLHEWLPVWTLQVEVSCPHSWRTSYFLCPFLVTKERERERERHRFTFVKKDSYQEESSCLVFLDILWKKRLCAAFKCVSPFIAWIPLRRMWTDDKMTDSAGERFERR